MANITQWSTPAPDRAVAPDFRRFADDRQLPLAYPSPSPLWWLSGGATNVVAAWAAKGVANYATSKVNLVDAGIHALVNGSLYPTWDAINGWALTRTGSSETGSYLVTDIAPGLSRAYTVIVKHKSISHTLNPGFVVGCAYIGSDIATFGFKEFYSELPTFIQGCVGQGSTILDLRDEWTVGCVAGNRGYINGISIVSGIVSEGGVACTPAADTVSLPFIVLGGTHTFTPPSANASGGDMNGYISSAVIYSSTQLAATIAAVGAAMP